MKYKQNLRIEGNKVISYTTHVATIAGSRLLVHGYWSKTTSKHINHVAEAYGLTKVDSPLENQTVHEKNGKNHFAEQDSGMMKSVAMVAAFGKLLCPDLKSQNDWQARMLKAGLGNQGLTMPENWDQLSEDEKAKRLSGLVGHFLTLMQTMIENLINGNLTDARKQAKGKRELAIREFLRVNLGWSQRKCWAAAYYLKTGRGFQFYCDADERGKV